MKKEIDERIAVIETEIKNINKSIDIHIKDQRNDFDTMFKKLDNLSGQFAGKWVEKVSIGVLIIIIAGVILLTLGN